MASPQRCVVVGTYEQIIKGFLVEENEMPEENETGKSEAKMSVKMFFADKQHLGGVTSLCAGENGLLISGSSDETMRFAINFTIFIFFFLTEFMTWIKRSKLVDFINTMGL
jgi:hypothetical protein